MEKLSDNMATNKIKISKNLLKELKLSSFVNKLKDKIN